MDPWNVSKLRYSTGVWTWQPGYGLAVGRLTLGDVSMGRVIQALQGAEDQAAMTFRIARTTRSTSPSVMAGYRGNDRTRSEASSATG